MPGIVQLVPRPRADVPIDRLWLVFFGNGQTEPWWARILAPGYRHVAACAWFAEQERWVYFNPTRRGTVILLYREDEFGGRFTQLMASSTITLRVIATHSRLSTPFGWWCTGSIKALLGVRGFAVTPRGLCRLLLRQGSEIVTCVADAEPSSPPSGHVEPVHPGRPAA